MSNVSMKLCLCFIHHFSLGQLSSRISVSLIPCRLRNLKANLVWTAAVHHIENYSI